MSGTRYVAGFLIDRDLELVALVRKNKPAWQAGRLNGIGGKIEPGETAAEAMTREFAEEAGVCIPTGAWDLFAEICGEWGSVTFFRTFGSTSGVRTMESEQIEVHHLPSVAWSEVLPNLSWLLPLAIYTHDTYDPVIVREAAG